MDIQGSIYQVLRHKEKKGGLNAKIQLRVSSGYQGRSRFSLSERTSITGPTAACRRSAPSLLPGPRPGPAWLLHGLCHRGRIARILADQAWRCPGSHGTPFSLLRRAAPGTHGEQGFRRSTARRHEGACPDRLQPRKGRSLSDQRFQEKADPLGPEGCREFQDRRLSSADLLE